MKQKWKQKLPGILLGLVFLVGLGIFAYPTVADQWNKYHQSRAIASYEETVADMDEVDYQKLWEMGMMMLPPTTISMPFKILLFVLADGWNLVIGQLVKTFY